MDQPAHSIVSSDIGSVPAVSGRGGPAGLRELANSTASLVTGRASGALRDRTPLACSPRTALRRCRNALSGDRTGRCFDDLAGPKTAGAHSDPLRRAVHERTDALNVRVPATLRADVAVADTHAERRLLAAHFTDRCHRCCTSCACGPCGPSDMRRAASHGTKDSTRPTVAVVSWGRSCRVAGRVVWRASGAPPRVASAVHR